MPHYLTVTGTEEKAIIDTELLDKPLRYYVSPEDFIVVRICDYKWFWTGESIQANLRRNDREYCVRLHRLVMECQYNEHVHHKALSKLDCRKASLEVTETKNYAKAKRFRRGFTSKGVYYDQKRGKWYAQIGCNGKHEYLGRYSTKEAAMNAYDEAAAKLFGEYSRTNRELVCGA